MEAKQCPPQHGSGMAGMKHMLEYVRSNKAPYNIPHVQSQQALLKESIPFFLMAPL